jgi:TrmH family RNA methyltransferase
VITSAGNQRLKLVRRLASRAQRHRLGLFVCEGEDLVQAALDAGLEPVEALVDAERPVLVDRLANAEAVAPDLLAEVSSLAHAARVVAVFRRGDLPSLGDAPPTVGLALWHVSDPGNLGTIVRSADALGAAFVGLSQGCADPTGSKALRASAGAVFRVPLARFDEAPGRRIALVPHGAPSVAEVDLSGPVTFVVGAERAGLPENIATACEMRASIPQEPAAESLNVAVAAAIALYERRRRVG